MAVKPPDNKKFCVSKDIFRPDTELYPISKDDLQEGGSIQQLDLPIYTGSSHFSGPGVLKGNTPAVSNSDSKNQAYLNFLYQKVKKEGVESIIPLLEEMDSEDMDSLNRYIDRWYFIKPELRLDRFTKIRDCLSTNLCFGHTAKELAVKISFIPTLELRKNQIIDVSADGDRSLVALEYSTYSSYRNMPPDEVNQILVDNYDKKSFTMSDVALISIEGSDSLTLTMKNGEKLTLFKGAFLDVKSSSTDRARRYKLKREDGTDYQLTVEIDEFADIDRVKRVSEEEIVRRVSFINRYLLPHQEVKKIIISEDGESFYHSNDHYIVINSKHLNSPHVVVHEMGHAVFRVRWSTARHIPLYLPNSAAAGITGYLMMISTSGRDEFLECKNTLDNKDALEIIDDSNYTDTPTDVDGHPGDGEHEIFASSFAAYFESAEQFREAIENGELDASWRKFGAATWKFQRDHVWRGAVFTEDSSEPPVEKILEELSEKSKI